jgi:hypothetical protein
LRFGRMTSGETVFNPRKLARVIFGLACRLLHKRDIRHVQRTIQLAPNKRPDHMNFGLAGPLECWAFVKLIADSRFGSQDIRYTAVESRVVIACYRPGRKLSPIFGWMPRHIDPIRLHRGWSGSRDLLYLHLVQASPIGLGGIASVQM